METAMVTGRMTPQKKEAGNAILKRAGLNASQAINRLYDRLIEERDAAFIQGGERTMPDPARWRLAAEFVDAIPLKRTEPSRFDAMTKAEIKMDRLRSRGLV